MSPTMSGCDHCIVSVYDEIFFVYVSEVRLWKNEWIGPVSKQ